MKYEVRKVEPVQLLSAQDPIRRTIGKGASGKDDVSVNHDKYLAAVEVERKE